MRDMVKLINHNFGTITYVSEERLEKYLSAGGYSLAESSAPADPVKKEPKPKKAAVKKEK